MELATTTPATLPTAAARIVDDARANVFAAWLANRSAGTARVYRSHLENFAAFLGSAGPEAALRAVCAAGPAAATALANAWRSARESSGASSSTVAGGLAALSSLLKLAHSLELVAWNVKLDRPTVEARRDMRGPQAPVVREMVARVKTHADARTAARDAALLGLLAGLGLRRAEATGLDLAHVDLAGSAVLVLGKARRERERVAMPANVRELVAAWIAQHPRREEPSAPLFVGLDRSAASRGFARLTGSAVALIVERAGELAGATGKIRPHGLRHAAATTALEAGADLRAVAALLRHRNVQTTFARYDDSKRAAGERAGRLASAELLG